MVDDDSSSHFGCVLSVCGKKCKRVGVRTSEAKPVYRFARRTRCRPYSRSSNNTAGLEIGTGLESSDLIGDLGLALLVGELGSFVLLRLGCPILRLVRRRERGVLTDLFESFGPHVFQVVRSNALLESGGELLLESLVIFLFERLHVFGHVSTVDVRTEEFGVELLGFRVVTGETLLRVRNKDSTVGSTLEGTKDTRTGRGTLQSNVEETLEGTRLVIAQRLNLGHLTIGLSYTLVLVSKTEDGECTTGDEQTSGVSGGPVGKPSLDTVTAELLGRGLGENLVTVDLGVNDLASDV